jgi:hypothetical protein
MPRARAAAANRSIAVATSISSVRSLDEGENFLGYGSVRLNAGQLEPPVEASGYVDGEALHPLGTLSNWSSKFAGTLLGHEPSPMSNIRHSGEMMRIMISTAPAAS